MAAPTTVYLIRHGRTALNAAGLLRGHIDLPPDRVGRTEAAQLGAVFKGVRLTAVVSSPLRRALETAAPVAAAGGVAVRTDPAFVDRDYGPWNGAAADKVAAVFGSLDAAPGVEPQAAFARRVLDGWAEVAIELAGEAYALVTHDAVCRLILGHVLRAAGGPIPAIRQRTGCWNLLELRGERWHALVVDAVPDDGRRPDRPDVRFHPDVRFPPDREE